MRCMLLAGLLISATHVAAQEPPGPSAGTWGIEGSTRHEGGLLRFRSPSAAWILQLQARAERLTQEPPTSSLFSGSTDLIDGAVRLGIRGYRRVGERVRPFTTFSLLTGYGDQFSMKTWRFGAVGELGAAYFFSRHVSLGGAGELAVEHTRRSTESGAGTVRQRSWGAAFNGFRLLGAVYF